MAILHDCPGLVVEIVVNGKPLTEYDSDEADTPGTITKYVEAETDQNFAIRYQCIRGVFDDQHDLKVAYAMDSDTRGDVACDKHSVFKSGGKHWIDGSITRVRERDFVSKSRFSALQILPHKVNPEVLRTDTPGNGYRNLSKGEIITLIRGYRKSSAGLDLLEHNELVILLLSYRVEATATTAIKREHRVAIKDEEDTEIEIVKTRSKKCRGGTATDAVVID